MSNRLYLINDDEPRAFVPRVATIVRDAVRVGNREGIFVVIEPPIENSAGNPLAAAILIPRHKDVSIDDLRGGAVRKPASVFVCRVKGDPPQPQAELLDVHEVTISFWGLVSGSPDFGGQVPGLRSGRASE
jgi:hypothetical protein